MAQLDAVDMQRHARVARAAFGGLAEMAIVDILHGSCAGEETDMHATYRCFATRHGRQSTVHTARREGRNHGVRYDEPHHYEQQYGP